MTFFFDAGMGRALREPLQQLGIEIVLHDECFPQGTDDTVWIPYVAERGWLVLTRDRAIGRRYLLRQAVIDGSLKMFALGCGSALVDVHASVIKTHLKSIAALAVHMPAPFIARLTVDTLAFRWLGDDAALKLS